MTPLWRFYARWISSDRLVGVAVTLTYALVLLLLFYGARFSSEHIIYIDLQAAE